MKGHRRYDEIGRNEACWYVNFGKLGIPKRNEMRV